MNRILAIAKLSVLELFRKRDVYVALVLALAVAVPLAAVNAFGVEGAVRYIREVTLLLIWAFSVIVCVTTSARQFPAEIQRRTILPLLSKPVSRSEVVIGKVVGSVLASWAALALFYLCFILISGLKSGYWLDAVTVQGFILHACFAMLVCCLAVFGSMFLTLSGNVTCCILLVAGGLIFGDRLPTLVTRTHGLGRYLLMLLETVLPRVELFDLRLRMIHGWPPVSWTVFAFLVLYAGLYSVFLVAVATAIFKRKHF